ncbi:hypothetical protein TIFTF001_032199 [Ficus carica]|uniref:Uncharacterized protein n=1 Tax=Ficus carica TaxID=3494 RepID=A0AA88DX14_FICCA|nr:hypothetical protein TIFTF001_032199 [Ficus carica]
MGADGEEKGGRHVVEFGRVGGVGVGLGCTDLAWGCPVDRVWARQEGCSYREPGLGGSSARVWLIFTGGRERGVFRRSGASEGRGGATVECLVFFF